jgi:sterol desaturase/sphingolipid hydroxylase (fatty acid hydroxylase superfamily)
MGLFTLEHSRAAARADMALHGSAVVGLAGYLLITVPMAVNLAVAHIGALVFAGLAGWTLIEYVAHRFVLHRVEPFRGWHAQHHLRPTALIYAPTVLIAALVAALVFLPARCLGNAQQASALTLGLLIGYLAYSITHHATHHWRADNAWLKRRKRWHALHHQQHHQTLRHHPIHNPIDNPIRNANTAATGATAGGVCFGVTTSVWDSVFGSADAHTRHSAMPHRQKKAGDKKVWNGA